MYSSPAPAQGAKNRPTEFVTREARDAWWKAHRCIPPWLLPPAERKRRHAEDVDGGERERGAQWLVEPIVFPLVERLSRGALGYCNATEYSLRALAWIDSGHLYGERSISRRLRLEHARGKLHRKVIPRGARFKNGRTSTRGTTANRFPSEAERRERLWREREAKRKARREERARKRATRLIAQTRPQSPAWTKDDAPRSALPVVMSAAERATLFCAPSFLSDVVEPRGGSLSSEQLAERRRKVDEQLAAARALRDLWDDEPPD